MDTLTPVSHALLAQSVMREVTTALGERFEEPDRAEALRGAQEGIVWAQHENTSFPIDLAGDDTPYAYGFMLAYDAAVGAGLAG